MLRKESKIKIRKADIKFHKVNVGLNTSVRRLLIVLKIQVPVVLHLCLILWGFYDITKSQSCGLCGIWIFYVKIMNEVCVGIVEL